MYNDSFWVLVKGFGPLLHTFAVQAAVQPARDLELRA